MDNIAIYGTLSLIGVQFLTVIFGTLIYARQKSALSVEQRDRGEFRPMVQKALALAADALAGIERIDVEQYRALAKKLGEAHGEIEMLKAQIMALKGSIESAHNKLAGYTKLEKRAAREEAEAAAPAQNVLPLRGEFEIPPGVDPIEWMKSQGLAQPLGGQVAYQQQVMPLSPLPRSFGKQSRG
jgi:septal ring factor EnvC (AmiA/AmiB activator)